MKNIFTKSITAAAILVSSISYSEAAALRDKNGELLRGTAMVIAAAYDDQASGQRAFDIDKWQEVKDLGFNTIRLAWVGPWIDWSPNHNHEPVWTVDELLPKLDIAVANATATGMNIIINYHHVGEWDKERDLSDSAEFWRKVAPRYANNDLVYYELNNEQIPNISNNSSLYKQSEFKNGMRDIYQQVRRDAKDRHIIMFSFNSMGHDMKGVADNYGFVDWSNTSVGYHFYGNYTRDISKEEASFLELINSNYTTICTEWAYSDDGKNYIRPHFGEGESSEDLARYNQSLIDWRPFHIADLGKTRDVWIPDAQEKGYWWGNGGGVDDLVTVSGPITTSPGATATISVDYEATAPRDILIKLENVNTGHTTEAYNRTTVSAGSGTLTETVTVDTDAPIGSNYHWQAMVTTVGGDWNQRLDVEWLQNVSVVAAGAFQDDIDSISGPANVSKGSNVSVSVNYEASVDRDILIYLQNADQSYKTEAFKRVRVSAGSGTITESIQVDSDASSGNNYHWQVVITPVGGGYADREDARWIQNVNVF